MILKNSVFDSFISNYATQHERTAAEGLSVINVHLDKDHIQAQVEDDKIYFTSINFNSKKVTTAVCTCFHDKAGACRHVIATLKEVDQLMAEDEVSEEESSLELVKEKSSFTILNQQVLSVELGELQKISVSPSNASKWHARLDLREAEMAPNFIAAKVFQGYEDDYLVRITQGTNQIHLTCTCYNPSSKLCSHMYHTFLEINREDALQLPFNQTERIDFLQKHAVKMGLTQAENWDDLFELSFSYNRLHVNPKYTMLSLSTSEKEALKKQLLPHFEFPKAKPTSVEEILIVEESNYNKQLVFHLCEAQVTKSGELKTPIDKVDLNSKMRSTKNPEELLFFAALLQQDPYKEQVGLYEDILRNPLGFKTYFHIDGKQSKRIFLKNLEPIKLEKAQVQAQINVKQSGDFYVLTCEVKVENSWFSTRNVNLLGTFFLSKDVLSWIQNDTVLQVIKFFKTKNHEVFIHKSQFATFREEFLEPLEDAILVKYAFVKKAPAKLIKSKSLDQVAEYLIYLSESDDYVLITPVIMYGETEVNVLSKRTVLTENPDGSLYSIDRKKQEELVFIEAVKSQHPSFEWEQQTPFFYLHKQEFLDRGWFLEAFENWRAKGYSILGFNQLKNNRYNSNKIKVLTTVKSGIDWFDAEMKINFGKISINLKDIQKAVTNRSKYVELGDGTIGILPDEWIQKFTNYFRNSEINGDHLKIHKSNFQIIDDLFDQEVVDREVLQEIHQLKAKLASFKKIQQVQIPNALNATLRDYQKEGLNWLNFLDEFGFGGILADDMGLGKTIQMIAFMLLQLEKGRTEPNLVVVPTSLL
ncbi:MAG TPA: SNF2-related protein, partial [Taishania sp.]|nr:SNF2-related protein [Taishania sp.]